jgi:2-polyprenyl-6-hydroxyphenyl methylase/3-demethylubiquinone-9 3-methyltransferase
VPTILLSFITSLWHWLLQLHDLTTPQFTQHENFRDFYESVAQLYPEEEIVYETLRGRIRKQFVLEYLKKFHGKLLDLGCNRGFYISQYKNGQAFGVDIAYAVLKKAHERFPQGQFIEGDAQNLSFIRSNSFDSILCSEMIEHVPFPQKVFTECYRILKPQGLLLITTPNYTRKRPTWTYLGKMKDFGVKGCKGNHYFHTAFRPEELKTLAEKSGFEVLECGTFEKEVKYSTRIPVLFHYILRFINKFLRSKRIDDFNEIMLERCSFLIYNLCTVLRLNHILTKLVKEGVRSYLLVKKSV